MMKNKKEDQRCGIASVIGCKSDKNLSRFSILFEIECHGKSGEDNSINLGYICYI